MPTFTYSHMQISGIKQPCDKCPCLFWIPTPQCADAGANCFIAGSGMFAYPTLKEGCDDLRKVAQEAQKGNVLSEPQ